MLLGDQDPPGVQSHVTLKVLWRYRFLCRFRILTSPILESMWRKTTIVNLEPWASKPPANSTACIAVMSCRKSILPGVLHFPADHHVRVLKLFEHQV